MAQVPGQPEQTPAPAPAPAPAQNPQVVQSGSGGTSWSKIVLTVVIILVVTAVIAGAYWFFVINNRSLDNEFTGKVTVPKITETASPSATSSAD